MLILLQIECTYSVKLCYILCYILHPFSKFETLRIKSKSIPLEQNFRASYMFIDYIIHKNS